MRPNNNIKRNIIVESEENAVSGPIGENDLMRDWLFGKIFIGKVHADHRSRNPTKLSVRAKFELAI